MTVKFGRNYTLSVWAPVNYNLGPPLIPSYATPPIVTINYPTTMEFDIVRKTLAETNVAQLRFYNLSDEKRQLLRFNISDYGIFQQIQLCAGYGENPPIVFTGNISQAWSAREGQNMITQIECYDGGYAAANGYTTQTFPKGTPWQTVISSLISGGLLNIKVGAVGAYQGELQRAIAFSGNTMDILGQLTNGGFFIDNGKGNALLNNECIPTPNPTNISTSTGLLNTPLLENSIARFDMVFEPTLHCGELVNITSQTNYNFNGTYIISGVKHHGVISGAICGAAITTGEFFYLNGPPIPVATP